MVRNEAREACVDELRALARGDAALPKIRKDASRSLIDGLMEAIRASEELAADAKADAERVYAACVSTFEGKLADPPPAAPRWGL